MKMRRLLIWKVIDLGLGINAKIWQGCLKLHGYMGVTPTNTCIIVSKDIRLRPSGMKM